MLATYISVENCSVFGWEQQLLCSEAVELGLLRQLPEAGAGTYFTRVLRRNVTENCARLV